MKKRLEEYLSKIEPKDLEFGEKARKRQDNLTKPQGSLGRLEDISIEVASMTRSEKPTIDRKVNFVCAGDHGVASEGVSAFPQEVTVQMVYNFISGGAAINVLAKNSGAEVVIGDFGIASKMDIDHPNYFDKKVGFGTKSFIKDRAMSKEDAIKSILNGIELFEEVNSKKRIDLVSIGEMGIANTTPATAILSTITGESVEDITGRGSGINDSSLLRKIEVIKEGLKLHNPDKNDGIDILSAIGGYEIGGMAGVVLAAAIYKIPVVIDGFISTSAALIAQKLSPLVTDYIIASHSSVEHGHIKMLDQLGKKPLFDLNLRLGEGTGAVLAMNIVEGAVRTLSEMATFEEASVSNR
ncbi:MAG: nicotinate-nucleotide--dimethylbenzimidazole phosphoribosyltransferase [Candidatus Cloacimonadota bacterium]|nr:MAG: nicotinate-nucleotide--dimethylbenzimidazole phosphoribosyltransferase [Candidatus Cloacimonadota bacterium]PIE77883.1 MAG: nicotinate-nucleotide--dimethylbenzimidazole phosphoribosyltransferase [Candidatus Delongbacteria bacterium]